MKLASSPQNRDQLLVLPSIEHSYDLPKRPSEVYGYRKELNAYNKEHCGKIYDLNDSLDSFCNVMEREELSLIVVHRIQGDRVAAREAEERAKIWGQLAERIRHPENSHLC